MRLFLDTNILIDFYLRRRPFFIDASRLFVMRSLGDAELWASAKSFTDVFFVSSKAVGSQAIQEAMEHSLPYLRICSIDAADVQAALADRWPDFEDRLVARAAEKVDADYIITRDRTGFERSRIRHLSPTDLFDLIEREQGLRYEGFDL